jgi:CheY-like chemotaxis protein
MSVALIPHGLPVAYISFMRNPATSGASLKGRDRAAPNWRSTIDERAWNEPEPLRVYIVEDSSITRRLLASAIEAAGAQVSGSSAEAQTAIGDLFALQPDLILIDIGLASGSGLEVLKALQDHSLVPAAMKVVLTNYAGIEYKNLSVKLGADRFFDKSFEISQALALISTLAAEARRGGSPPH